MFQIVYTSTALDYFGRTELTGMLKEWAQRNRRTGVTGLLLFKDGCFMQVLEGEGPVVRALFKKISSDPRHHNVISLMQEPIQQRQFSGWPMAFRDLKAAESRNPPGFSEFLDMPLDGDLLMQDIPKCHRLLMHFNKNIR